MNPEPQHPDPKEMSPAASLGCAMLFALPFMLAGSYIMAISFGYLPADPESFKAPRLVVAGAGAVFVLGGLMVILRASFSAGGQESALYKWLEFTLVTAFLILFAGVFIWVGLGPGERAFETSTSVGPVTTSSAGNPVVGRCLFGGFGIGMLLAGLFYIYKKIMTLPMGGDGE